MPFDPENRDDLTRLKDAVKYSRKKMEPFIQFRHEGIREMVGGRYGDTRHYEYERTPVNQMAEFAIVMSNVISARNPRVMVTTFFEELISTANSFSRRLNQLANELKYARTARLIITDALFGPGFAKDGISVGGRRGMHDAAGEPFFDHVSFADMVVDMSAKEWELIDFIGNRYRRPLEHLTDNPMYDQDVVRTLKSTTHNSQDEQGIDRDEKISMGSGTFEQRYRRRVELYDVYLPEENVIVTLNLDADDALRIVEFDGPSDGLGPYTKLCFYDVPGQLLPLPPAAVIKDLSEFVNIIYRKIFRQAQRQKEVGVYLGELEESAKRVRDADDGELVRGEGPGSLERIKVGGADPQTIATAIHSRQLFSRMAGNLDVLGGLGASADTATQENILNVNASQRAQEMQDRFVEFTQEAFQRLAWYEWTDPIRQDTFFRRIGETDLFVPELWSPETREGDFVQYDINIEPFSMQRQSPSAIMNMVFGLIDRSINLLPLLQQQGITLDLNAAFDIISQMSNRPEVNRLLRRAPADAPVPTSSPNAQRAVPNPPFGDNGRQSASPQSEEDRILTRLLSGSGESATVGSI